MFYKPKFCCNCGEKIEQAERNFLSSSRFCDVCSSENVLIEWLPRAFAALAFLAAIVGFGSFMQKPENSTVAARHQIAVNAPSGKNLSNQNDSVQTGTNQNVQNAARADEKNFAGLTKQPPIVVKADSPQNVSLKQFENQKAAVEEKVYFCGAPTRKGTPCSRRVKGGGRCWQHAGQTAMMPQEKLLTNQ